MSFEPATTTSQGRISRLAEARVSTAETLVPPTEWSSESLLPGTNWRETNLTLSDGNAELSGIPAFGRSVTRISVGASDCGSFFQGQGDPDFVRATLENSSIGRHTIRIGDVKVVEHVLSMWLGFGFSGKFATSGGSLPTFSTGLTPFIDSIRAAGIKPANGQPEFVTVREPVAVEFGPDSYLMLLPDDGTRSLRIDHQLEHTKNALGAQRVKLDLTPELFAYICDARAPTYGIRNFGFKLLQLPGAKFITGINVDSDNTVIVTRNAVENGNKKFDLQLQGEMQNYEVLMHEVIDKLGAIALISPGQRFVGTVVTSRTNHERDLEALRQIQNCLEAA